MGRFFMNGPCAATSDAPTRVGAVWSGVGMLASPLVGARFPGWAMQASPLLREPGCMGYSHRDLSCFRTS